jgi:peptide/nickel transport system substrate-binding protein
MKRVLAALLALAAGWLTTVRLEAAETQGGTLVFGRGSDSITLDPPRAEDGESVAVIDNVFDSLVRYSDDGRTIEPALADRWTCSPDGKTWTFDLAQGVKFHDGTDFDAASVVFTFERLLKKDHPFHDVDFVNTELFEPVEKVEATGAHTVVFTLSRPLASFLANLTIYTARIVSPTALKTLGARGFAEHPVGTGAFVFGEWKREQKIVLEANKSYWKGRPLLDRVILVPIKENATRLVMLKAGKLHVMDGLSPTVAKDVASDPSLTLLRQTGMNVGYLAFNCEKKPWDDPRARRAVALAVDAERIVATNFQGMGTVAKNPMPPFIFGWDDSAADPKPRRDEARKLLADAGLSDLKLELLHMSTPRPYFPEPKQTALVLQDDLKQVGIEASLATMDWKQYIPKTRDGGFELCLMGWTGDTSDPDNFLYVLLGKDNVGGTNVSRWKDPVFNGLCIKAQSELDLAKRKDLYVQAQKKIREEWPLVPLVHADQLAACSKNVHGMVLHPTGRREFRTVSLEK